MKIANLETNKQQLLDKCNKLEVENNQMELTNTQLNDSLKSASTSQQQLAAHQEVDKRRPKVKVPKIFAGDEKFREQLQKILQMELFK